MKNFRNTAAKTAIQNAISNSEFALSHSEIQAAISDLCDRVTTYRVLERLADEGSIHKIINTDGVIKYATCTSCSEKHNHNHAHFSCEKCKTVTCLQNVEPVYKLPEKYLVNEANFVLSGLCPNCL